MVLFGIAIAIFYQSNISLIKASYYKLATRDKVITDLLLGTKQLYRLTAVDYTMSISMCLWYVKKI